MASRYAQSRILLADPNLFMRRTLREVLFLAGFRRMVEAADGAEAIALNSQAKPDLIMADWALPLVHGQNLIRLIRDPSESPDPTVPIIVLSARPTERIVRAAMDLAVDQIVAKPFSPKGILKRVETALASRAATRSPPAGPSKAPGVWELR